ncbi:quinone-dependent dihydroorotate dehydrogenase [Sphingomonas japonica]|uniref:Dihydroorotate dehydrogenase (quinone) n=2 Tax=Sphingomonas japonica TaxID=511662 RepID=A0ABX0TZ87_9SPHN|nr:quinone-dependent dihydroorotate dehydrogenase [Sphingomonas japonica]NIJ22654.1 dihydroorotate dehydrogenase [Sphingomonas japonica]
MTNPSPVPFPRSMLLRIEAERAHRLTIRALAAWGAARAPLAPRLSMGPAVTIAGLAFPNRLGLAAGVDKDAEAIDGLLALGFGHVEVGTLTPLPQRGNPRPRLFRLVEDAGVINRMGFNNRGIDAALPRIAAARRRGVVGVNVGANKDSADRVADYAAGVRKAAGVADYVTINVSSPNTPGLRDLQAQPALGELLAICSDARALDGGARRPLFLKVAPDLDRAALAAVIDAAVACGIDALIVANTTIARPAGLRSINAHQAGGLSGAPLAELSRAKLAQALEIADGAIPIVSVGGIASPQEALRRVEMGAALVQLYSGLVYQGPGLVARIVRELQRLPDPINPG